MTAGRGGRDKFQVCVQLCTTTSVNCKKLEYAVLVSKPKENANVTLSFKLNDSTVTNTCQTKCYIFFYNLDMFLMVHQHEYASDIYILKAMHLRRNMRYCGPFWVHPLNFDNTMALHSQQYLALNRTLLLSQCFTQTLNLNI